ncbi:FtsX-like permease family protein [Tessaracoccus sp. MC1865]|uniref:FtsX-like permease family protein n=1 Tax=Tessaracoccus sp. MC1865 TaxID=2760310 RepID=UPI0016046B86|nr:FtsX-like permease family protein [Tessaracoccus sp. MC1865]MBB1483868.1 FtsX-like permease family protein [Tessaracoccus sp. MC1865]QTO36923.1 FtsX-like permease family protein [Tessaracoccus sp. MC1865]
MTALKLLWRQFSSERWPALLLALSVLIIAALTTATPRLMANLDDRQLAQTLSGLSALQGDVAGTWAQDTMNSPVAGLQDPWEPHRESLETLRGAQPEPLRSLLAAPQFMAEVPSDLTVAPPTATGYFEARFLFFVDPDLAEHAQLVAGSWPSPRPTTEGPEGATPTGPQKVAALAEVAERLGWEIGEQINESVTLSGTFRPLDEGDTRWEHIPYARTIVEQQDANLGTRLVTGLFLPPSYLSSGIPVEKLGPGVTETLTMHAWFGVDTAGLADVDVRELRAQLTGLLAQRHPVLPADPESDGPSPTQFRLESELGGALTSVAAQQDVTRAAVAVAAVGPLAVGLALLVLAAQLVIERRRGTVELVTARGLSWHQLRSLLSLEGLLLGVPAAVLGHLLGEAVTPGGNSPWGWAATLLIGAAAALTLSWAARHIGPASIRADLALRPGRWRVVAEVLTVISGAAGLWALLSRGDTPTGGLDLLATATPVLLTVAACLLALRLYPLPLRVAARWLRPGRGVAGFLGSVRAHRDPAGGLTPVFTVVMGTTIAVLSATLLGSVIAGTERATWEANGSSVHISGPRITDEMLAELQRVDGVLAVARIHDAGSNHRLSQGGETRVRLWLAVPAIEDAYAASPFGSALPAGMFAWEGAPGIVLGDSVPVKAGVARLEGIGDVTVLDTLPAPPGVRTGAAWAMMSAERWAEGQPLPPATLALVSLAPGTDSRAARARIGEVVGNARITVADEELRAIRETPTVSGLTTTFAALTAATATLLTLTLLGSQLMATRARTRLGAVLRTLGMGRRELRALTAWEIAPSALLGLLLGVGVGIALAALLLATLDFRSLTGGSQPPPLHLDPALLGGVGALLTLTVAVTIAATAWLVGRTNLAQELRIGEER